MPPNAPVRNRPRHLRKALPVQQKQKFELLRATWRKNLAHCATVERCGNLTRQAAGPLGGLVPGSHFGSEQTSTSIVASYESGKSELSLVLYIEARCGDSRER